MDDRNKDDDDDHDDPGTVARVHQGGGRVVTSENSGDEFVAVALWTVVALLAVVAISTWLARRHRYGTT